MGGAVPSPQRIRWIGIVVSAALYVALAVAGLLLFGGWHLWWPFVSAAVAVGVGFLVVWLLFRA
jgi:hypothetical protein